MRWHFPEWEADLDSALSQLRVQASSIANNVSVVEIREQFSQGMINVLNEGADNLTLADVNEESANLLALQTRRDLASASLSLIAQAELNVLSLFS